MPTKKSPEEAKDGTPELVFIDLKGKKYLPVAQRLVWFRFEHPDWTIETELHTITDDAAICRAAIKTPEGRTIATATKTETQAGFADFIEKAETGAIGRALALCGYGTQFAPELDEGERIVDAPQERPKTQYTLKGSPKATPKQLSFIKSLCLQKGITDIAEQTGVAVEDPKAPTVAEAKKIIDKLLTMKSRLEESLNLPDDPTVPTVDPDDVDVRDDMTAEEIAELMNK